MVANYKKSYKYNGVTYDWAGKLVTGTSETAKKFAKSGLPSVAKNDTYLNTEKGHVYICTEAGDADHAKWKYKKTVIVGKPTVGVDSMALKRGEGNRVMTASWKLPAAFSKETRGRRAEAITVKWMLDTSTTRGTSEIIDKESRKATVTSDIENLADIYLGDGSSGKHYTRADFYPHSGKPKLNAVSVTVAPTNSKGAPAANAVEKDGKTPVCNTRTFNFAVPKKPTFSGWSFNTETGVVSGTITVDAGDGQNERLWTSWKVTVTDTSRSSGQTFVPSGMSNDADTRTSIPVSYNASNYQSLTPTQYIKVSVEATAKGYAGDSKKMSGGNCVYYLSFPKSVSIKSVKSSSPDSSGKLVVGIDVSKPTEFPVDRVKLQVLADVEYAKESEIPGSASWDDAGAVDDGNCTALVCGVADVMPSQGKHSWVRVKAWHASESALFSYSRAVEVKDLFEAAPSAADNKCTIADADSVGDGCADVLVAWDEKNTSADDDTTSMELAWSDDPEAWRSTESPKSHEFDWKDSHTDSRASSTWNKTANVRVAGLSDGTTYYFRARCIGEHDGVVTKGDWCNPRVLKVASTPASAVIAAGAVSPTGVGVLVSWALSSTATQERWQVVAMTYVHAPLYVRTKDTQVVSGKTYYTLSGGTYTAVSQPSAGNLATYYEAASVVQGTDYYTLSNGVYSPVGNPSTASLANYYVQASVVVAEAEGQDAGCTVPWDRVSENLVGGVLTVRVDCFAGGEAVSSDYTAVTIANPPTLELSVDTLETQPLEFAISADMPVTDVAYTVRDQDGNAVATGMASPVLTESNGTWTGTVGLDGNRDFLDGLEYSIMATAMSAAGLTSEPAEASFAVDWDHKAPAPPDGIEIDPEVIERDNAEPLRRCTVTLTAPSGAAGTDVYDVFRITHDGLDRISPDKGLSLDYEFVDDHAPFGDAADYGYRIQCRTADGDTAWLDYGYYLEGGSLRFDFGAQSVELPYNIGISDKYAKDAETRMHLDGTSEAYFNPGVTRKAALSTDVIRIDDAEKATAVRALARYPGTAFVRTPDGSAYEAHVDVSAMDVKPDVLAVSIDAVQVATGAAYKLPVPLEANPEPVSDGEDEPVEPEE